MTRVDFYILPEDTAQARLAFTCRLVDKVQRLGRKVFIATQNIQQTEQLDKLLWQFRPESFIPHASLSPEQENNTSNMDEPVLIGHNTKGGNHHDLLINLGDEIPDYFSRFERLSEIVIQEQNILQKTRAYYKFYRERGYPIQTHDMRMHVK